MCRFFVDVFFVGGVQTDIRWIYIFNKNNTQRILGRKYLLYAFFEVWKRRYPTFPVFNAKTSSLLKAGIDRREFFSDISSSPQNVARSGVREDC